MDGAEAEQDKEVKYPKIIALGPRKFGVVDLNEENHSENAFRKLLNFHIGTRGENI